MRLVQTGVLALFCLVLTCQPAWAAQFSHDDLGFELSLPDQWTEAAPAKNVFVYHPADAPADQPPLLVVRVEPYANPEEVKKAAALAVGVASDPRRAIERAASVRLKNFTKGAESLDRNTGTYDLEFTCGIAFAEGDFAGRMRIVPSTKGLFMVACLAAADDSQDLSQVQTAMSDMDIEGQSLVKGAGMAAQIMQALEGRGPMLLLSLVLTCLSLFMFFRYFRKDKTARTLIAHERGRRKEAKKPKKPKK